MTNPTTRLKLVLGLVLAGLVLGCTEAPVEECEPGVGEMSEMGTVAPTPC